MLHLHVPQANSFGRLRRELDARYGKPDALVLFSAHWEAGGSNEVRRMRGHQNLPARSALHIISLNVKNEGTCMRC